MRTDYRIDDFQQNYFIIDGLEQLLDTTVNTDFAPLYAANAALPTIPIADIFPGDAVIPRGTQEYALAKSGGASRSEERRGGNKCVRTCRIRGGQGQKKK